MKQTKRKRTAPTATAKERAAELRTSEAASTAPSNVTSIATRDAAMNESATVEKAVGQSSDAPGVQRPHSDVLALGVNCTVRDCSVLKSELLDLLTHRQPVTIDVTAVERIDTAAMQVLCAFVRDRHAAGGQVLWTGMAPSFAAAVRLLGLKKVLSVSDAQLTMGPA